MINGGASSRDWRLGNLYWWQTENLWSTFTLDNVRFLYYVCKPWVVLSEWQCINCHFGEGYFYWDIRAVLVKVSELWDFPFGWLLVEEPVQVCMLIKQYNCNAIVTTVPFWKANEPPVGLFAIECLCFPSRPIATTIPLLSVGAVAGTVASARLWQASQWAKIDRSFGWLKARRNAHWSPRQVLARKRAREIAGEGLGTMNWAMMDDVDCFHGRRSLFAAVPLPIYFSPLSGSWGLILCYWKCSAVKKCMIGAYWKCFQ